MKTQKRWALNFRFANDNPLWIISVVGIQSKFAWWTEQTIIQAWDRIAWRIAWRTALAQLSFLGILEFVNILAECVSVINPFVKYACESSSWMFSERITKWFLHQWTMQRAGSRSRLLTGMACECDENNHEGGLLIKGFGRPKPIALCLALDQFMFGQFAVDFESIFGWFLNYFAWLSNY